MFSKSTKVVVSSNDKLTSDFEVFLTFILCLTKASAIFSALNLKKCLLYTLDRNGIKELHTLQLLHPLLQLKPILLKHPTTDLRQIIDSLSNVPEPLGPVIDCVHC
jgi:hypothetical protein